MPYTAYTSVAKMGLSASGGGVKEQYIPLIVFSSGLYQSNFSNGSSPNLCKKGTNSCTSTIDSTVKLHTLNPNWSAGQKFALEASFMSTNATNTATVQLYDLTASAWVASSSVNTTNTTATVMRSGAFTLIPGHVYGVALYVSSTSYMCQMNKAHLVAIN